MELAAPRLCHWPQKSHQGRGQCLGPSTFAPVIRPTDPASHHVTTASQGPEQEGQFLQ